MRIFEILNNAWHCFRRCFFDRYDMVKAKSLSRLEYYDKDIQMLHICFQILVNFVEVEMEPWDAYDDDHEIMILYHWWKGYLQEKEPLELYDGPHPIGFYVSPMSERFECPEDQELWEKVMEEQMEWENNRYKKEQEMLKRLIEIRPTLWT